MAKAQNIKESLIMKGFQQGIGLTRLAKILKIPINPDFDKIIVVNCKTRSIHLDNIEIDLLGPTKKNVGKLQKEWNKWLRKKIEVNVVGLLE